MKHQADPVRARRDPYPALEPLMLEYAIILQDPTERDADAAGHFGNCECPPFTSLNSKVRGTGSLMACVLVAAFYWFRRGRGGPDRWYDAWGMISRGEYTNAQMDTLAFNRALDSASRVTHPDAAEREAQAALPQRARKRALSRVFGQAGNYYVLPPNKAVVERRAWGSLRTQGAEKPSFGRRPDRVSEEEVSAEEIDAEVEADAQLQRELAELDHEYENKMLSLDQEEEAAALGEIKDDNDEEPAPAEVQRGAKQRKQRINFAEEDGPSADEGEEEVLEPDEFPEDREAEEELGVRDEEEDEEREHHEHKGVNFDG